MQCQDNNVCVTISHFTSENQILWRCLLCSFLPSARRYTISELSLRVFLFAYSSASSEQNIHSPLMYFHLTQLICHCYIIVFCKCFKGVSSCYHEKFFFLFPLLSPKYWFCISFSYCFLIEILNIYLLRKLFLSKFSILNSISFSSRISHC